MKGEKSISKLQGLNKIVREREREREGEREKREGERGLNERDAKKCDAGCFIFC